MSFRNAYATAFCAHIPCLIPLYRYRSYANAHLLLTRCSNDRRRISLRPTGRSLLLFPAPKLFHEATLIHLVEEPRIDQLLRLYGLGARLAWRNFIERRLNSFELNREARL